MRLVEPRVGAAIRGLGFLLQISRSEQTHALVIERARSTGVRSELPGRCVGGVRLVGWTASASKGRALALGAIDRTIAVRMPAAGLVHHSDCGSAHVSADHRAVLAKLAPIKSMSRKGHGWDNAVAEGFFATIKGEMGDHADYLTLRDRGESPTTTLAVGLHHQPTPTSHARKGGRDTPPPGALRATPATQTDVQCRGPGGPGCIPRV